MQRKFSPRQPVGMLIAAVLAGLAILLVVLTTHSGPPVTDLAAGGRYYLADASPPPPPGQLDAWLAQRRPVERISLLGGDYWLYAELLVGEGDPKWVFDASNTLIQHIELRLDDPAGRRQSLRTGYGAPHDFTLHYGKVLELAEPGRYELLVRFSSPYFRSFPRFELWPLEAYQKHVLNRSVVVLGCLGALVGLALFNLFLFLAARQVSQLRYAAYLLTYAAGWSYVFNLPADLLGWTDLRWNYLPFFLLPVLNTLFYLDFLNLGEASPRLARASRINFVLPLALLPSCFVAPSWAHALATVAISVWIVLALACGIVSWRSGYRPARFFVLAFVALLLPAILILPSNLGLPVVSARVDTELLTLLGGTLDGLLLAFAVADRYRMLGEQREQYLRRLDAALTLANTDGLTGVGNRYAFDEQLRQHFVYDDSRHAGEQVLVLIDLDGLKPINDRLGYAVGDALLRQVAQALAKRLERVGRVYRLGGDEFAILSLRTYVERIEETVAEIERDLVQAMAVEAGISHGIAYASEAASPAMLVTQADTRMYLAKGARKAQRRMSA